MPINYIVVRTNPEYQYDDVLHTINHNFSSLTTSFISTSGGTITGDLIINGIISGGTFYGDGSNLSGVSSANYYTTGGTLIGTVIYFDRTDQLSAYSVELSGLTSGITISGNYLPLSGGTVTGNTNFTAQLLSGGTDLYNIFITNLPEDKVTYIQPGLNTYTGGTENFPNVNVSALTIDSLTVSGDSQLATVNVSDTLTSTNITASTVSASTFYSGTTALDDIFISQLHQKHIFGSLSSGIISGGSLSININDNSKFDVAAGYGVIVDNWTDTSNPIIYSVIWPDMTGITPSFIATSYSSHISIDKNGTIVQTQHEETNSDRRDLIMLAQLNFSANTIISEVNEQYSVFASPIEQYRDLLVQLNLISEGNIISANGSNLQINKSTGSLFGLGVNFDNDNKNPNQKTFPSQQPVTFQYRTQSGGTFPDTTNVDPTNYDLNGVVTPVPGNQATNQRIYLNPNGNIRIQYGQTTYSNLASAVAGLQYENFVKFQPISENSSLIGVLSVQTNCTDLSDTSKAKFILVSKFGETVGGAAGIATGSLQDAYSNSVEPEITTNSTLGAVSIKNGAGTDNQNVFEIISSAGTINTYIKANGDSYFGRHMTATTVEVFNYIQFDDSTPVTPPTSAATVYVVDNNGKTTLQYNDSNGTPFRFFRDNLVIVRNQTGSNLTKGQAVYVTGSTGNIPRIALAKADSQISAEANGILFEDINTNSFGYMMTQGVLSSFDTSSFSSGSDLYLSPTTPGGLTATKPSYPNFSTKVGVVLVSGVGNGSILVQTEFPLKERVSGGTFHFTENVSVNGAVSATTYYGNGANLTGISSSGNYLPLSGGTVTGNTTFQSNLVSNTLSATTVSAKTISHEVYTETASTLSTTYVINGNNGNYQSLTFNTGTTVTYSNMKPGYYNFIINLTGTTTLTLSGSSGWYTPNAIPPGFYQPTTLMSCIYDGSKMIVSTYEQLSQIV